MASLVAAPGHSVASAVPQTGRQAIFAVLPPAGAKRRLVSQCVLSLTFRTGDGVLPRSSAARRKSCRPSADSSSMYMSMYMGLRYVVGLHAGWGSGRHGLRQPSGPIGCQYARLDVGCHSGGPGRSGVGTSAVGDCRAWNVRNPIRFPACRNRYSRTLQAAERVVRRVGREAPAEVWKSRPQKRQTTASSWISSVQYGHFFTGHLPTVRDEATLHLGADRSESHAGCGLGSGSCVEPRGFRTASSKFGKDHGRHEQGSPEYLVWLEAFTQPDRR